MDAPPNKPGRKYKWTPPEIEKAIAIDLARGDRQSVVAERYKLSSSTVERIWRRFREAAASVQPEGMATTEEFTTEIRQKARRAVAAGLECEIDQYRRGKLGVDTLTGIGDWKKDGVVVNNFNIVAQTPAHWRARYLGIEEGAPDENESEGPAR